MHRIHWVHCLLQNKFKSFNTHAGVRCCTSKCMVTLLSICCCTRIALRNVDWHTWQQQSVWDKAATDPKKWIRDPAGSDPVPDPDPLTHGTIFHWSKIPQNVQLFAYFFCNFLSKTNFSETTLKQHLKWKFCPKIKEQILNAQNSVKNLVTHNSVTDPDLEFWIRVVSRSGSGSVAALVSCNNWRRGDSINQTFFVFIDSSSWHWWF